MKNLSLFRSVRWKFIFIYFLLVFIALMIVGVFIIQQLESYHLNKTRDDFERIVNVNLLPSYENYTNLEDNIDEIQINIEEWAKGIDTEILLINPRFKIIASDNSLHLNKNAIDILDEAIIIEAFKGESNETDSNSEEGQLRIKNMTFPVYIEDEVAGVLYLRANLNSVYETLDQSKVIFVKATLAALFVTIILGYLIARSITEPINDVTEKVKKMAQGDFRQNVSVKSDDEIGRLAEMFNFLRRKLDHTLSEISNEKSKVEAILENIADGVLAVNTDGEIIHLNQAAIKMLNLKRKDIGNKDYNEIIASYSEELTLEKMANKKRSYHGTVNFQYNNSSFNVRYAPFQDEQNENTGVVMIIQDVTEREKYENMQKEFVANVSHELKTPLTSIKSYVETLLDGAMEDHETSEKFLTVVDSEADRMTRLVKDLLQLSRLDYNREKIMKQEINIVNIIKLAVEKMEISAKTKEQELEQLFIAEDIRVFADKDRIEQVILNILSNAIKYTGENGSIKIDIVRTIKYVKVIVEDNGMGISAAEVPKLFDRFYRVDKARSRAMGGTGLGLSIAKQIVSEHGGDIEIESEEGRGTTVVITLPLIDPEEV